MRLRQSSDHFLPTEPPPAPRRWRWLSWLLALAGLGWIGFLLRDQSAVLAEQFRQPAWGWLALATLLGTLAVLHDAAIFALLLEPIARRQIGWLAVARLFFVGQMIRHLPGRFWGVLYQISEAGPALPPWRLVQVNLDFMLVGLAHSLIVPAALFLDRSGASWWGGVVVVGGLGLLALLLRLDWFASLQPFLPKRLARYGAALLERPGRHWRDIGWVLLLVLSHWGCYLAAWCLLGRGLPQLTGVDLTLLCAAYSVAWAVGFVSLLTPAGLGVREASFLAVAGTITTPGNLAFLAVFVRLWLLLIDLILFLCFVFQRPHRTFTSGGSERRTSVRASDMPY